MRPLRLVEAARDVDELVELLKFSSTKCDALVVSGGIGPEPFDTTALEAARALGEATERELCLLDDFSGSTGRGWADRSPGTFTMKLGESEVIFLPGTSPALDVAIEQHLLPLLAARRTGIIVATHTIRAFGPSDGDIKDLLGDLELGSPDHELELHREGAELVISLSASAKNREAAAKAVHHLGAAVCAKLGLDVHGPLGQDLPQAVSEALRGRSWTLATVEVGTGGLIPERVALDEERSSYFVLGLVSEDMNVSESERVLSVVRPVDIIRGKRGKRGERAKGGKGPDAMQLARGIKERSGADVGLALVGLLGPRGGSTDVPTGLVHFAVTGGGSERSHAERFHSVPRRHMGQWIAARALRLLLDHCREKGGGPSSAPSSPST